MAIIIIRTIIIYAILIGAMRLMGKRQIGQLEISDLVSTLLLSELAALPIENHDIQQFYSIIPTVMLMAIEIFSAALQGKFPKFKNLFSPRPSVLIRMGKPDFNELQHCRMSYDELLVALRKTGTTDISEVAYAILEQDGSVSVLPRVDAKPATAKDVSAKNEENGMFRIIIDKGIINSNSLKELELSDEEAEKIAVSNGFDISAIELMLADEAGNVRIFANGEINEK